MVPDPRIDSLESAYPAGAEINRVRSTHSRPMIKLVARFGNCCWKTIVYPSKVGSFGYQCGGSARRLLVRVSETLNIQYTGKSMSAVKSSPSAVRHQLRRAFMTVPPAAGDTGTRSRRPGP